MSKIKIDKQDVFLWVLIIALCWILILIVTGCSSVGPRDINGYRQKHTYTIDVKDGYISKGSMKDVDMFFTNKQSISYRVCFSNVYPKDKVFNSQESRFWNESIGIQGNWFDEEVLKITNGWKLIPSTGRIKVNFVNYGIVSGSNYPYKTEFNSSLYSDQYIDIPYNGCYKVTRKIVDSYTIETKLSSNHNDQILIDRVQLHKPWPRDFWISEPTLMDNRNLRNDCIYIKAYW